MTKPNPPKDGDGKLRVLGSSEAVMKDRAEAPVCGELVLKPWQAGDTGFGNDFASGRNADLPPSAVSSRFFRSARIGE